MKTCCLALFLCLASLIGFTQERAAEKSATPKPVESPVSTDSVFVSADKNFTVTDPRKKKEKRARNKKECSRMKS